jgi:hypothetical protein
MDCYDLSNEVYQFIIDTMQKYHHILEQITKELTIIAYVGCSLCKLSEYIDKNISNYFIVVPEEARNERMFRILCEIFININLKLDKIGIFEDEIEELNTTWRQLRKKLVVYSKEKRKYFDNIIKDNKFTLKDGYDRYIEDLDKFMPPNNMDNFTLQFDLPGNTYYFKTPPIFLQDMITEPLKNKYLKYGNSERISLEQVFHKKYLLYKTKYLQLKKLLDH